ncbi:CxxC-x17-CxxC domain-containing protein [Patescibacteria group bacterium]
MGDFRKGGNKRFGGHGGGFGRRDGGRGGFGGGRDRGPVTMHQATCDQCGKQCEVPFKPTSGKPVYCNDCFGGKKEIGNNRGGDRFSRRNYDSAPTRSDFRSDIGKGSNNEVKKQLEILNGKMDLLIKAVEAISNTKPLIEKSKIEKSKKKKKK